MSVRCEISCVLYLCGGPVCVFFWREGDGEKSGCALWAAKTKTANLNKKRDLLIRFFFTIVVLR